MAKGKSAVKEPEVEELEELDDDVEAEETKSKKGGAQEVTFGVADLVKHIKDKTGKDYSTRDVRTLIRKMAREDKPRVDREIVAGNRSRYDWPLGTKDPEVKAIIKAIGGGEVEAGRKEALDKLKQNKAEKDAAKGKKDKKGKKNKPAPVVEDDDDDVDIEDEDDE